MKYKQVFIYALIDPRTDKIRYIGKSIHPELRYEQHLNEKEINKGKIGWIDGLRIRDLQPEMKILEVANEKNWDKRERWWIERGLEFGWPLLNISPGGESGTRNVLPSSLYWLLESDLLEKLESLPNRVQADIILQVAKMLTDGFKKMVKCYLDEDYDGYFEYQRSGRVIVKREIKRLVEVKTRKNNKEL